MRLFLQECKVRNLTNETIRRYGKGLAKFRQHLETRNFILDEPTTFELTHYIIPGMLDEGLALRTANCNLCILKEFLKFLASEGWMVTNIAAEMKPFKIQPSLTHTFTDGHLQSLFAQPDRSTFTGYRNYVMMLVLLETGIRLKELVNLRIPDCHFEEGLLLIQQGKGRKARSVPIQKSCSFELLRYIKERGILEHDHLWVNLENRPLAAAGIRIMVSRYCNSAGIRDIQCSCHTFRHTMAKKYLLNGGDVFTLKSIMGHERIDTTEMYVELFSNDLQIQHEKFSPLEHLTNEFPSIFAESGEGIQ